MALHNKKLAHDEEKPCFLCGEKTKALSSKGVMEAHPRCPKCKARLADEHTKALAQQRKQDQASRSPRKEA